MPELICQVLTCAHYNSGCCCKQEIHVDGKNAREQGETCCESYYPMTNSYQNAIECDNSDPKREVGVHCHAQQCYYNQEMLCTADHIDIGGQQADNSTETLCSTFKMK
ncbi:MAG: DUF1540 domain-containing protein [Acetanaerobacterium sp.]